MDDGRGTMGLMRILDEVGPLREFLQRIRNQGKTIGFVPTMGAFHEGHLSLMRRARAESDIVVVSDFVNPTQFPQGEDYDRYPRNLERDRELAESEGVDLFFAPTTEEIHAPDDHTAFDLPDLATRWEGAIRPGHFEGVATVCAKLFNIVRPDRAYFGMKDYQQLKIIQRLVAGLNMPIAIVPCPTIREPDGLAMSSRNAYLNPEQRRAATVLFRALIAAEARWRSGERDARRIEEEMEAVVASEQQAQLDYAAVAGAESLEPLRIVDRPAVALIAGRIGRTRLIDSLLLNG